MTTANIYLLSIPIPPDLVLSPHSQPCIEKLNKTAKTTVNDNVVQEKVEATSTEVEEEVVQIPSQITVELECTAPSCNFGGYGIKYKTPPLLHQYAIQLLEMHSWSHDVHDLGGAEVASDPHVTVPSYFENEHFHGCSETDSTKALSPGEMFSGHFPGVILFL